MVLAEADCQLEGQNAGRVFRAVGRADWVFWVGVAVGL